MKTWFCVTSAIDDSGRTTRAAVTAAYAAERRPESGVTVGEREHVYTDWFESREEADDFVREVRGSHDAKGRMAEILRSSEVSQRRLGLLVQMRSDLAKKTLIAWVQDDQLREKYAELVGKLDDAMVAEAQYLTGLYDGVTDIAAAEAKCLTEIFREPNKGT